MCSKRRKGTKKAEGARGMRTGLHHRVISTSRLHIPFSSIFIGCRSLMASTKNATTNCAQSHEKDGTLDTSDAAWREKLSPAQYRILRGKGTDPRGIGYDRFFEDGKYLCAACGSLLYTSAMKFHCPCGWPAFFDCVPKAVREERDRDGQRCEILCNRCNSHLGHVFRGEGFDNPPPNERHCVNSTSITFVAEK